MKTKVSLFLAACMRGAPPCRSSVVPSVANRRECAPQRVYESRIFTRLKRGFEEEARGGNKLPNTVSAAREQEGREL